MLNYQRVDELVITQLLKMGLPTEMIGVLSPGNGPSVLSGPSGLLITWTIPRKIRGFTRILWLSGYDLENDHSP